MRLPIVLALVLAGCGETQRGTKVSVIVRPPAGGWFFELGDPRVKEIGIEGANLCAGPRVTVDGREVAAGFAPTVGIVVGTDELSRVLPEPAGETACEWEREASLVVDCSGQVPVDTGASYLPGGEKWEGVLGFGRRRRVHVDVSPAVQEISPRAAVTVRVEGDLPDPGEAIDFGDLPGETVFSFDTSTPEVVTYISRRAPQPLQAGDRFTLTIRGGPEGPRPAGACLDVDGLQRWDFRVRDGTNALGLTLRETSGPVADVEDVGAVRYLVDGLTNESPGVWSTLAQGPNPSLPIPANALTRCLRPMAEFADNGVIQGDPVCSR